VSVSVKKYPNNPSLTGEPPLQQNEQR